MLQNLSRLKCADNTGAKTIMVVRVLGGYKKHYATVGQIITGVVKEAVPHASIKKSDIVHAVVVRTKKEIRRSDGSYVRFSENACVIIDKAKKEPKGTRVFGPIAREVKKAGFSKVASLAPEVL